MMELLYGLRDKAKLEPWSEEMGCVILADSRKFECSKCGQTLGRVANLAAPEGYRPDPSAPAPEPWPDWAAFQWALLRTLHLESSYLPLDTLALPVPQASSTFMFGPHKEPLPAGALLLLWLKDKRSRPDCGKCGGPTRAYGFGGLLNLGGYDCLCLYCGEKHVEQMGGLGAMSARTSRFLEGTPWYLNGARFGSAVASDGAQLGLALELGTWLGEAGRSTFELRLKNGQAMVPGRDVDF
jgi:hypothetical protein